jgi:hypothetical protein
MKAATLTLILLTAIGAQAKLNPADFPLEAKVIDLKAGDAGAVSKTTKGVFCDN